MQNFHPLFTHFPIALLLVSAAAALVAHFKGTPGAHQVARVLLYLGTAAGVVTAITGFLAAQTVAPVAGMRPMIEEHQTYAYILLGIAALLSAWSLVSWRRHKLPPRPTAVWLLAQGALVVLVFLTAMEGGELVYELGVGTELTGKDGPLYDPAARVQAADSTAPNPSAGDFK